MSNWTEGSLELGNVKAKIEKLLALSQSDNVHEAAAACAKAQVLMERYQIDEGMLREASDEDVPEFTTADVKCVTVYTSKSTSLPTWMIYLNQHICRVNRCCPAYHAGSKPDREWHDGSPGHLYAYGCPPDVEVVATMIDHLADEVNRLYKANKPEGLGRGQGRTWANNFRLGCVAAIGKRLREAQKEAVQEKARELAYQRALADGDGSQLLALDAGEETDGVSSALVLVSGAVEKMEQRRQVVKDYFEEEGIKFRKGASRSSRYSGDGYSTGRKAGENADIGAARRKKLG